MSDEDALLAAIDAHPAEDTPRLMFADWLDEHGHPLRAEFIRLSCAMKAGDQLAPAEQRIISRRLEFIRDNHRRELIPGPLGGELTALGVTFDRGFLSELRITALQFVLNPQPFAALRPLPRVRIRNLTRAQFDRFIARPELACVVAIAVNVPGPNAIHALATCPHLTRLESLDWTQAGHRIGDAGLGALAFSNKLPKLVHLDASSNEIGDVGVAHLVASPLWRRLKRLNLGHNDLSAASAEALVNAPPDQLEALVLHGTNFGSVGRQQLTRRFGTRILF